MNSETHASAGERPEAETYEIRLSGHLDAQSAARAHGPILTHEPDGTTLIRGRALDQAALFGLLQKVRDVGLPLISVMPVEGGSQ